MSRQATRVAVSAAVVIGALSLLMYTTVSQGAQYYKHVDEVMANPTEWYGKTMQLHGFVVAKSIETRPNTLDYRFRLGNGDYTVLATYTGAMPDGFKEGAELVLTGRMGPNGFQVDRDGVSAKCPSKYQAAGPTSPTVR